MSFTFNNHGTVGQFVGHDPQKPPEKMSDGRWKVYMKDGSVWYITGNLPDNLKKLISN